MNPTKIRRAIVICLVASLVIFGFYWIYSHSFIEITVNGSSNGANISYSFLNQSGDSIQNINSTSTTVKHFVKKGNYELVVKSGEQSYFSVTRSSGFLKTTTIQATLTPENARTFIGDNPDSCTSFNGKVLFSYTCNGVLSDAKIHIAATKNQPTYTKKRANGVYAYIQGMITNELGNIALLRIPNEDASDYASDTSYALGSFDDSLGLTKIIPLDKITKGKDYRFEQFKNGYLLYSSDFSNIYYISSLGANTETITTDLPKTKGLAAQSLSHNNQDVALLYGTNQDKEGSGKSEIIIKNNTDSRHYILNQKVNDIEFCGVEKLCILSGTNMEIYTVGKKKLTKLYSVKNVSFMKYSNNALYIARKDGVLTLNTDSRSGNYSYTYGDFKFYNLRTAPQGYTTTIQDSRGKEYELLIDTSSLNTNSIDKKINELQKSPGVSSVSINRNYIFIVPNYGQAKYDNSIKGYRNDQSTIDAVNQTIQNTLSKLNIPNTYIIINTGSL